MKFKGLLLVAWIFVCNSLSAQWGRIGYIQGSVVLTSGDSLSGWINPEEKFILFKNESRGDETKYKMDEVVSFSYSEGTYVVKSVEVLRGTFPERVTTYLHQLLSGPLDLYQYTGSDRYKNEFTNFFIEDPSGSIFRVDKKRFRKIFAEDFSDCTSVADKIRSGEITYDNLPAAIIEFNTWANENKVTEPTE